MPSRSPILAAPGPTEGEISLFGPGIGECVVVHLGGGAWMVVDSCLEGATREPVALTYLRRLGLDVRTALRLIVITHWHSDHIEGAARLMEEATSATIFCSAALRSEEFFALVAARRDPRMPNRSGIDEMSEILRTIERRAGRPTAGPEWVMADRVLLDSVAGVRAPARRIVALSPSSDTMTRAARAFERLWGNARAASRVLPNPSPNELSVVLRVTIGETHLLLGGDLERSTDPGRGWSAVLGARASKGARAGLFKVPHHGSEDADEPRVWDDLLAESPIAALTPFLRGREQLPTPLDLDRILERTQEAYITAASDRGKPPRRHPAVDRTMKEIGKGRRVVRRPMGHIQVRWNALEPAWKPEVRMGGNARRLG